MNGSTMRSRNIKKYRETNENEDTTIQNLRDTGKAFLRGKFIALPSISKKNKTGKAQINDLTLYFKELEKEQ